MKILITGKNQFSGSDLDIGREYIVEPYDSPTEMQNRLFHKLLEIYFNSGVYSYPAKTYEELKQCVKKSLGAGFVKYVFILDTGSGLVKGQVKNYEDVPKNLALDKYANKMVYGVLKSWSKYSRKERTATIQNLITEMINLNINSKGFHEILNGLEERKAG